MARPKALLLFNPNATTTDDAVRDVIASALASEVELSSQPTKQRGHATHLAAGAVHEGVDVVFALGGDGTANEVLQALAGTPVKLGIIPGGSTNVFARALGLPNEAVHATSVLLEGVREGRSRSITLGRAGTRYFGFNAGFGFDAAVIRHVEQHEGMKRTMRQGAFLLSVAREWTAGAGRDGPTVIVELPDGRELGPVAIAMIGNTDPYTYLGSRPMHVHPQASFETGLDLMTIATLSTPKLLRVAAATFRGGRHTELASIGYHHDLASVTLSASTPQPLMVDGDYAGEHLTVRFEAIPNALEVIA